MPFPVIGLYYAIFFLGIVLLVRAYREHTGLWVSGYRKGRTRLVAVGLGATTGVILLASAWLQHFRGMTIAPFIGGVVAAAAVTVGGYLWQAAFRHDLETGNKL